MPKLDGLDCSSCFIYRPCYLKDRLAAAEDEIDVALNVAALVVMPALVIEESVVRAIKCAMVESRLIARDHRSHRLVERGTRNADRSVVLRHACTSNYK